MDPSERSVYLTFDDGPIPESTPFLLETLRRYGVKATFFVVGENVQKHPDLFRQIIEDGHQVGNHTYHHLGSFKHWAATYLIDTFKCQQAIERRPSPQPLTEGKRPTPQPLPCREGSEMPLQAATPQAERVSTPLPTREGSGGGSAGGGSTGAVPPLFRPPHGWLRHSVYYWLSKEFRIVMWDLVTRDYSKWLTADDVYENVRRYARNGSIITFHDSLKSIDKLHAALPRSIEWLQEQGYEFRTF
jgi:peptidoglycan/xylan/chitin deacetylase (PgdA/CDA1 family)